MLQRSRGISRAVIRFVSAAAFLLLACAAQSGGQDGPRPTATPSLEDDELRSAYAPAEMSLIATIEESLFGDVYAEGRWRPLTLGSFFTDGWLEPWAAAPAGRDGLTPRHGWLGAFNGVFYRLWTADLGYTNSLNAAYHGNRYSAGLSVFLPFSKRFELLIEEPYLVANGTTDVRRGYVTQSGDLTVTPRFLLAETEATTHVLSLGVRTPTGSSATGGGLMALTPRYEFWTNPGGPWVVRGSSSFSVPIGDVPTSVHTTYTGGLAVGRYFTPHDVPFGDLVFYAACDLSVPLDGTASTGTNLTLGPGTRFHLGENFYLLNFWGFPVTGPHPDAYSVQFAIVKIF
jgi:hypothetical protein